MNSGIVIPYSGKLPEKTIVSDVGFCTKCFSMWIEGSGCTNEKCPDIVYRNINES
jgi:hypothetical protein